MPRRDGRFAVVDPGEKVVHEFRQDQLPSSKVAKADGRLPASIPPVAPEPALRPDFGGPPF